MPNYKITELPIQELPSILPEDWVYINPTDNILNRTSIADIKNYIKEDMLKYLETFGNYEDEQFDTKYFIEKYFEKKN